MKGKDFISKYKHSAAAVKLLQLLYFEYWILHCKQLFNNVFYEFFK